MKAGRAGLIPSSERLYVAHGLELEVRIRQARATIRIQLSRFRFGFVLEEYSHRKLQLNMSLFRQ
uniref:Uncharacterized protein n=1 Tax=Picea sitchensis TaxID=3332 RepID=A9NVU3_PICSI|nr:unknown [Picea sitchensis]